MRFLFILFGGSLLITGCKERIPQGIYDKGRIEYRITYLENNLQNISAGMLPKKMKLEFNQEYSSNLIEGFMGVFRINNVINFKQKRSSTLLEVLNKNYVFRGKRGDPMCCFEPIMEMSVQHTDETRQIAGLECKKAIVRIEGTDEEFDVFYTKDISLSEPNATNPYRLIDGVLMEFQLCLSGLKMRFTAERFESIENIQPNRVSIPSNSAEVTREQMMQIINKLME